MPIAEELKRQHVEVNEDGDVILHPGYIARICDRCGRERLQSIRSTAYTCGAADCIGNREDIY